MVSRVNAPILDDPIDTPEETVQTTMILQEQQEAADKEEKEVWIKKVATEVEGIMELNKRPCLPRHVTNMTAKTTAKRL